MRYFKTVKGFLKSCYSQVSIEQVMSGRATFIYNGSYKHENFKLSNEAIREIADGFSKYLYSSKERANDVYNAFMNHRGDYFFSNVFILDIMGMDCVFQILSLARHLIIAVGNL